MCLLSFAIDSHPRYRLVLAANRDERLGRPTAPARFWDDAPQILAGRDLEAGGTWLEVSRSGRLVAVTNYYDHDILFNVLLLCFLSGSVGRCFICSQFAEYPDNLCFKLFLARLQCRFLPCQTLQIDF